MHQPTLGAYEEGVGFFDLQIVHRPGFSNGVDVPDFTQSSIGLLEFSPTFSITEVWVVLGFGSGFLV